MIAVFSKLRDFKEINFQPKTEFIRINSTRDIAGRKFTGVIQTYAWWDTLGSEGEKAFELLKELQPELFEE